MINVLVVEDYLAVLQSLGLMLSSSGFSVLLATNGQEATSMISSSVNVSLILTDFEMPEMDGLELIRKYQGAFPIILMSGRDKKYITSEAGKRGVCIEGVVFLPKPLDFKGLIEQIKTSVST